MTHCSSLQGFCQVNGDGTQGKDLDRIVHVLANEVLLASYISQILDAELHYGQIHDILQSFHQVDYAQSESPDCRGHELDRP